MTVDRREKPHISKRCGYWRVSLTPRTQWGRKNRALWIKANEFTTRLNKQHD